MEETAEKAIQDVDYAESVEDFLSENMFSLIDDCAG